MTGRLSDAPVPKKTGRRRGGDDRMQGFRNAAALTRSRPARAAATALQWLASTVDWLDLWQHNDLPDDPPHDAPNNDLSPRP